MGKEVTCSICGKVVHKRKTLHIGNGKRACREHKEVEQQAQQEQNKIKVQHEATAKKYRREPQEWDLRPKCGVCGNVGLPSEQFYSRLLIENEKYQIQTGKAPNPFDVEEIQKAKGKLKDVRCLIRVGLDTIKKHHVRLTRNAWQATQLIGLVFVCADCINEHRIEIAPKPEWEDIKNASIAYETFVRPAIQEQAREELGHDQ